MVEAQRLMGAMATSMRGAGASLPSSRPAADVTVDVGIIFIYAAVIFLVNWTIRLALVNQVAKALFAGSKLTTHAFGKKIEKFSQSAMEASIYGLFAIIGLVIVPSQPWVWPSSNWWIGFADPGAPHALMRDDLRCYYLLYTARYMQNLVSVLLEPKRKDFVEMCIHHLVTVIVAGISYWYGWNRIGVVVMVLLDPADVPLHVAKMCKYLSEDAGSKPPFLSQHGWATCADRMFEFFAVVFFLTRCVVYPYVCWSAHIEATRYFPKGVPEWMCVFLLHTLLVLQFYWFSLLLKVAIKMARGQHVEDVRSDDEDEPEPTGSENAKGAKAKKSQ